VNVTFPVNFEQLVLFLHQKRIGKNDRENHSHDCADPP
jgi:hypothetical protein